MGLDITGYSKIVRVEGAGNDPAVPVVDVWANCREFAARAVDVPEGTYTYASRVEGSRTSYTTYNRWRDTLCWAVHRIAQEKFWDTGMPDDAFYDLINFSDCEGTIGTAACKRLSEDFTANREKFSRVVGSDGLFMQMYDQNAAAFAAGADGGCVTFK